MTAKNLIHTLVPSGPSPPLFRSFLSLSAAIQQLGIVRHQPRWDTIIQSTLQSMITSWVDNEPQQLDEQNLQDLAFLLVVVDLFGSVWADLSQALEERLKTHVRCNHPEHHDAGTHCTPDIPHFSRERSETKCDRVSRTDPDTLFCPPSTGIPWQLWQSTSGRWRQTFKLPSVRDAIIEPAIPLCDRIGQAELTVWFVARRQYGFVDVEVKF